MGGLFVAIVPIQAKVVPKGKGGWQLARGEIAFCGGNYCGVEATSGAGEKGVSR